MWTPRGASDGLKDFGSPTLVRADAADAVGTRHVSVCQTNQAFIRTRKCSKGRTLGPFEVELSPATGWNMEEYRFTEVRIFTGTLPMKVRIACGLIGENMIFRTRYAHVFNQPLHNRGA